VGAVVGGSVGTVVGGTVGSKVGGTVGSEVGGTVGSEVGGTVGSVVGGTVVSAVVGTVEGCVVAGELETGTCRLGSVGGVKERRMGALPLSRPEKVSMTASRRAMLFIRIFMGFPLF